MIGYYVHHHGVGHLTRACSIAAASSQPMTVLSSLAEPAEHPFADWIRLDRDDQPPPLHELTAGGVFHWAPKHHSGYRSRMRTIVEWITRADPAAVVVDVSVEVATWVRLAGVPVVVMAGPGRRDDAAHTLAYNLADAIIAPWPEKVYRPRHLDPYQANTQYVGAISRFDGRPAEGPAEPDQVLALFGRGGSSVTDEDLREAEQGTPGWRWTSAGGGSWRDDVWMRLGRSAVVVCHAGQNVLAEVAAARRPAIVVAQARPFDEQRETAAALSATGLATVVDAWPAAELWPSLLADAVELGGDRWTQWSDGLGGSRAAEVIERVATTA